LLLNAVIFLSANLPCSYSIFDVCRAPQKILLGL